MSEELGGVVFGEPVTVNHIILDGSLVVLTDGRLLNVPAKEARVMNLRELFRHEHAAQG